METSIQTENSSGISMEKCIRDCTECYQDCISCITHCLSQGGKHAEQSHISTLMECAQFCQMSASLMLLKGKLAFEHCQLCAQACDSCAESCEEIDPNDSMMMKCAQSCRKCAESCRSMAH